MSGYTYIVCGWPTADNHSVGNKMNGYSCSYDSYTMPMQILSIIAYLSLRSGTVPVFIHQGIVKCILIILHINERCYFLFK